MSRALTPSSSRVKGAELGAAKAALAADADLRGSALCQASAAWAESVLAGLFTSATAASRDSYALVAVGGFGRGELCPASDIDVALVYDGRRPPPDVREVASAIWRPLWDAGIKLGNSVWSRKEALSLAATDLDTATTLLTARPVAGDRALVAALAAEAREQWRRNASRWLILLADSVDERHAKAGEVAFLLEPDIKEGRGGLRDVHALGWAQAASPVLSDGDGDVLRDAYEVLLAARVELHRRSGRASDRLLLQDQDAVALALGDADADVMMARLSAAARTIAWTSDDTWWRIRTSIGGGRQGARGPGQALGPGLVSRAAAVDLADGADLSDPTLVLRAAEAAASAGVPITRAALDRMASSAALPADPWPEAARRAFLRTLGAGRAAIPVLESLDQRGILGRLVPEWERVRCLPQRNAYHRFTVDRHLCETAAEAAALASGVHRPDLLLAGALLHDIGKGFTDLVESGDHSDAGVIVVETIATRMGFPPADVETLVALVRHHLLLPDVATRRDVDDPAIAAAVANAVGSRETLELLHALTEADSLATGPAAWSKWKAQLVADLVGGAAKALAGEPADPTPVALTADQSALAERVRLGEPVALAGRGRDLTIAAPDRLGLFCTIAGVLSLNRLDVLAARGWSDPSGVAFDELVVEPVFGGEPDWDRVEADLQRALSGRLALDARVAQRAKEYGGRSRLPAAAPARVKVVVDNEASGSATVVEVWAPDRVGVLYRITRALVDLHLDIRRAKVATLGHEVVDSFYVVDPTGSKITDPDHIHAVEQAVMLELSRL